LPRWLSAIASSIPDPSAATVSRAFSRSPRPAADGPITPANTALPLPGLTLVVADLVAAHAELSRLGAPLSEVVHYENGVQVPGHSDEPANRGKP